MRECMHTQRNELQYEGQAGSASCSTESLLLLNYLSRALRSLSKVPSCGKLSAASPLSRLHHEGKASAAGAAVLT